MAALPASPDPAASRARRAMVGRSMIRIPLAVPCPVARKPVRPEPYDNVTNDVQTATRPAGGPPADHQTGGRAGRRESDDGVPDPGRRRGGAARGAATGPGRGPRARLPPER